MCSVGLAIYKTEYSRKTLETIMSSWNIFYTVGLLLPRECGYFLNQPEPPAMLLRPFHPGDHLKNEETISIEFRPFHGKMCSILNVPFHRPLLVLAVTFIFYTMIYHFSPPLDRSSLGPLMKVFIVGRVLTFPLIDESTVLRHQEVYVKWSRTRVLFNIYNKKHYNVHEKNESPICKYVWKK